jgi:hypothetical protein
MTQQLRYPEPQTWNDVYLRLLDSYKQKNNPKIPKPPVPLILAAWWETSDLEKHNRWSETLEWVEKYGFMDSIAGLLKDVRYYKESK